MEKKVLDALEDYRYLLDRGYNRFSALNFVTDRYLLTKEERNILLRVAYPLKDADIIKKKIVKPRDIFGKKLYVDGYNVIITIESILRGKPVFLCDDGIIRDISLTFSRFKISEHTVKALQIIKEFIGNYKPENTVFILDKPKKWSGKLAELIYKAFQGLNVKVVLSKSPDKEVSRGEIIASSDSQILIKSNRVIDIPSWVLNKLGVGPVVLRARRDLNPRPTA